MIAWVFVSPSSWLKTHPHCNDIWRWGLWVTRLWKQSLHERHWCPSAEGIVLVQVGQLPFLDLMSDLLVFWVALLFTLVLYLWMATLPVSGVLKPCESRSWSFYLPSLQVHGDLESWSESCCFTCESGGVVSLWLVEQWVAHFPLGKFCPPLKGKYFQTLWGKKRSSQLRLLWKKGVRI